MTSRKGSIALTREIEILLGDETLAQRLKSESARYRNGAADAALALENLAVES